MEDHEKEMTQGALQAVTKAWGACLFNDVEHGCIIEETGERRLLLHNAQVKHEKGKGKVVLQTTSNVF